MRRTKQLVAALALAIVATGSVGCEGGGEEPGLDEIGPPNIILIVLDAASAAYFGAYGADGESSPNIDRLARESVVFENAYSQSPTTVPSTASLLTGVRGTAHRMTGATVLPREYRTAPEILAGYGYRAFGVIGNPFAGAPALGFDRGYEECVQVYAMRELQSLRATEKSNHFKVVLPEDINRQVFRLLPGFGARGTFAYIHYLQPHKPYDPPVEYLRSPALESAARPSWDDLHDAFVLANETGETSPSTIAEIEARYRANLRFVDAGVGALLERLDRERWYDDSLIVLMGDHGDAFFKHARFGHNVTLYDDMIRIPFLIKFPERDRIAPRRLPQLVETVDLLPTLFDYLELPIPEQLEGDSLWPLIQGRAQRLEGPEVIVSTVRLNQHAIRLGDHKYIRDVQGGEELYDLRADPDEQRNLIGEEPERARILRERLESTVDVTGHREPGTASDLRADPEMKRLLEILGYVGEEIPDAKPPPSHPPTPEP